MNKELVIKLQEEIRKQSEGKVIHILNGSFMLEEFKRYKVTNTKDTYLPFNEAMCWGDGVEKIFSKEFIETRASSLRGTIEQYKEIVIKPLTPLFEGDFKTISLWFDDDMFCVINMITVLAYLEQCNFQGKVLACTKLSKIMEMNIKGSLEFYKSIICNKEESIKKNFDIDYEKVLLYLDYLKEDSKVNKYIKCNINKPEQELIKEMFQEFPHYGLGDLQYKWLIQKIKNKI